LLCLQATVNYFLLLIFMRKIFKSPKGRRCLFRLITHLFDDFDPIRPCPVVLVAVVSSL